jgi:hypothetical protein
MMKHVWAVCLVLVLASSAQATDYFVDKNTGNDSNNGTSSGTAWLTLSKARNTAMAGDTVRVIQATYNESLQSWPNSGTSWANKILWIADNPAQKPTIAGTLDRCLYFNNSAIQYIEFDGFILDGTSVGYECIKVQNGHHLRFKNCEMKNSQSSGIHIPSSGAAGTGDGVEFIDCIIRDCGINKRHHGLYTRDGDDMLVDGCTFYNNAGTAMDIEQMVNAIVSGNTVYSNGNGEEASGGSRGGIVINGGTGGLYFNNIIYNNNGYGLRISGGATGFGIYNNVIAFNDGRGYEIGGGSCAINTLVKNNIAYENVLSGFYNLPCSTNPTFENNLAYNNAASNPISNPNKNYYNQAGTGTWNNNTGLGVFPGTDPLFTDAGSNDYTLQSNSPARDQGQTLAEVTDDFIGTSRPSGVEYDIGAYEFGGAPTNQAPSVDAGPNKTIQLSGVMTLDGTANDDGLPDPPSASTATWSKISGPGDVNFDDASAVDTTATFSLAGVYVLRLAFDDTELSTYAEMVATIVADTPRHVATKTQIAVMLMSGAML